MDSENNLLKEIKKILPSINDSLLMSITNKGILNRSKKDLEKMKDSIKLSLTNDNLIICSISNDINVIINQNIQLSKCSCPSQSICKHIIMSLLYIKQKYENEECNTDIEYDELKNISSDEVISLIGKKNYNSILQSIKTKPEAVFKYGDLLTADIKSQNIKVYFPKINSIKNAVCSCKEKGICKHKSYALISYLIQERKMELELSEENKITLTDTEIEFLLFIQDYISSVFEKGLMSITEYEIKNLEKLYQKAYSIKMFYIASDFKLLLTQISLYFNKNVSFSLEYTLHLLSSIYNRAAAMIKSGQDGKRLLFLKGKKREDSICIDNINFIGIGASCILTKRKDLLLNAYFY